MPSFQRIPPVHSPIKPAATARALARRDPEALARLEHVLASDYAADAVLLTGSGTQALQLALAFARRQTGRDAAALPAYTCYDLVTAAVGARVRPAFYDIDPDRLDPDPASLARAVDRDLAALVVVHHFGYPAPMRELAGALPPGGWLIEDAAQAHGGSVDGRRLGSLAPLSVLSFGRGKGWTGGGGGALLLRGAAASGAAEIRELRSAPGGMAASAIRLGAQWLLGRPSLYGIPSSLPWLGLGETHYREPDTPWAMAACTAAVVLANRDAAEAEAGVRRRNAELLRSLMEKVDGVVVPSGRGEPGCLRLPFRRAGRAARDTLTSEARALGVVPSYPRALPSLEAARSIRLDAAPTPGAETLARELLTAPTHSFLGDRELARLGAALRAHR